jgi:hypothetical protein
LWVFAILQSRFVSSLVVAVAWIAESSFVVVFFFGVYVCLCVCVCVCFWGLADAAVVGGLLCESFGDLGVLYIIQRGFWVWSF